MLSQNKIKFIRSLDLKKHRKLHNCFTVEGEKMVIELLKSHFKIIEVFALPVFISENNNSILSGCKLTEVNETELKKISSLKTPNKTLAVVEIPTQKFTKNMFSSLNIALDNLQDPGNLGTIIRTANWFGVKHIFCSMDTVDVYNQKVIQSTMGAIFRTHVIYEDLHHVILTAKKNGQKIYGTFLDGPNIYSADIDTNALIVFGNESSGISKPIENLIENKIRIPDFPELSSQMESLNVGIANAIILAEFRRRN